MTMAGMMAGGAVFETPAAGLIPEAKTTPNIERLAGVRILRGGAGWHGISLRVGDEPTGTGFDLALVTAAGHSVRIARLEEAEVVAAWRDLSRTTGLPMLVEQADGSLANPFPQLGRLTLGNIRIRRTHGALRQRRPRFLTRRKTGRLAVMPVIHRVDPVIDARDAR